MATVRDFQVNNGLEVNLDANVVGTSTALDFYGGTAAPTVAPSVVFDFARSVKLDSRLSFNRPTTATYRAANGMVVTANNDTPRFQYNSNGSCMGVLVERGSTNDALYSTNIGNTNYYVLQEGVAGSVGMTLNTGQAPDGSNTATYLFHATNTNTYKSIFNGIGIVTNRPYAHSVWVKANNQPTMGVSHYDGGDNMNTISILYTFATNTFSTSTNGSANCAIIGSPSVEPYKDGWYRMSYTYHYTGGPSSRFIQLKYNLDTLTLTPGSGLFYWGAQHEWNDKPTSFIYTTTGAATRAYEYLYCVDDARGNNLTSWLNTNRGTVSVEWSVPLTGPTSFVGYSAYPGPFVFWKSEGDGGNVLAHIYYADAGATKPIGLEGFVNNTYLYSTSQGNVANGVTYKTAAGFDYPANNFVLSTNGGVPGGGGMTNGANVPITARLDLGRSRANWLDGTVKTFRYWPIKLSNTDIQYSTLPA